MVSRIDMGCLSKPFVRAVRGAKVGLSRRGAAVETPQLPPLHPPPQGVRLSRLDHGLFSGVGPGRTLPRQRQGHVPIHGQGWLLPELGARAIVAQHAEGPEGSPQWVKVLRWQVM